MLGSGIGLFMQDGQMQTNRSLPSCVNIGVHFLRLMPAFELGIIKVFTMMMMMMLMMMMMMMSHCHQSIGLWNEPLIGQHIANA